MRRFIFICALCLTVKAIGQYTYELEDVNTNSSTYGDMIGASFFTDKIMLHYFGSFYWLICTTRFGELNDIYNDLNDQGFPIELVGIGKTNESSGLYNWTEGNNTPICADNTPYNVWNGWNATQRDLYITDINGSLVFHENITSGIPENLIDQLHVLLNLSSNKYPTRFHVHQNYPNPFNPKTLIRYNLPKDSFVNVVIYNILGQKISTLVNSSQLAGYKSISWDASSEKSKLIPAGLYFLQITANQSTQIKKMILLR